MTKAGQYRVFAFVGAVACIVGAFLVVRDVAPLVGQLMFGVGFLVVFPSVLLAWREFPGQPEK